MKTKYAFIARYTVDCVPPQSPAEVTEKVFDDELYQVINEEETALWRRNAHDDVHIASSEILGVEDVDVRTRVFTVRIVVKFRRAALLVAGAPEPLERVRGKLVQELHLETRQTEGPYNIVAMDLVLEEAHPAAAPPAAPEAAP